MGALAATPHEDTLMIQNAYLKLIGRGQVG